MKLGICVGRFQTPYLHQGHKHLLDTASKESDKLIIVLGCTTDTPDERNPYTYQEREQIILESYPKAIITYIFDIPNDNLEWSKELDAIIEKELDKGDQAILFGSRDSFINCYLTGTYRYQPVSEIKGVSATKIRENLKNGNSTIF